jgi:putative transcriptional regulator
MNTVEVLPWRYAPFFSRIAGLWDLSEVDVAALLERAAEHRAWRSPGLRGVSVIDIVGGERTSGSKLHLVRLAPGAHFPKHRHVGHEMHLVLEGQYTDSLGAIVRAGDVHTMQPGTEHSLEVGAETPCVVASIHGGLEFTGAFLRWWSLLVGQ